MPSRGRICRQAAIRVVERVIAATHGAGQPGAAGDARHPAVTLEAPCAKIKSAIAKTVFQIHAVDADGATVIRKRLRRAEVLSFVSGLEPCLIGMEACATSHYWARELAKFGHTVKLMPPAYVKPYGAPRRRVLPVEEESTQRVVD